MKLSILIPVYNEEKNIITVLKKIRQVVKTNNEIIVIYDMKEDPTYEVVKKYIGKNNKKQIRLVRNNTGTGRGVMNAIKTGFAQAKGDAVVIVMADLSDDLIKIDRMYGLIQNGYDIVCGSRYMKGGKKIGGPFIKTLLSKTAGLTLHYFFGVPTHDATNAFKMYRKSIFKTITIESTGGFEYSLEIILKAFEQGYAIAEIPATWKDRDKGVSKFKLFGWLPNYIKWYVRILKKNSTR